MVRQKIRTQSLLFKKQTKIKTKQKLKKNKETSKKKKKKKKKTSKWKVKQTNVTGKAKGMNSILTFQKTNKQTNKPSEQK